MLIVSSNKIKSEKIFRFAAKWIWYFLIFFVLISVGIILYSPSPTVENKKKNAEVPEAVIFSLEKIGQGAFSLNREGKRSLIPDMTQEVLLLAKNLRPGIRRKNMDFLLFLKSSKEQYKAKSGEQIFLSCDPSVGQAIPIYHFSDKKTPFWIKPLSFDKNKVILEVGLFFPSKQTESFQEEKIQFVLKEEDLESAMQKLSCVERLMNSKLWGQDILLARFGGDKYESLKDKVKLEIPEEGGSAFFYLSKGDYLQWEDSKWTPASFEDSLEDRPVAQIKSVTLRSIEIEVFDSEGFTSYPIKLDIQGTSRVGIKSENLPQGVRLRTSKQISCFFGKKRCLIKEGDWILKSNRGWRILRRSVDIDAYLHHKLIGELFIFSALERDQGKLTMKGFWVDEMRTQSLPFSVPVQGDPHTRSAPRVEKKSSFLKKSSEAFITYFPSFDKKELEEAQ